MLIYCAHKFGNDPQNREIAEKLIEKLQLEDGDNCYISPIHAFGHLYTKIPYEDGMELCFDLLTACDKLLVLSDESEGVRREIDMARLLGIEVGYYQS